MRKLLSFGVVFILVCMLGFTVIVSDAEPQTSVTVERNIESIDNLNDINDTMIMARVDLDTDGLNNITKIENESVEDNTDDTDDINDVIVIESDPVEDIYEIKSQEVLKKQEELESITDNKEWFVAYKNLVEEYSEWVDPPESIYDVYSSDDIYLMQRCIETETFEQDFNSKVNVASVILNRLNSEEFSNQVNKVIVKGQFAFGRKDISEDTKLALEYAYMIGDTTEGALYFHSLSYRSKFNGANYIFTDDAGHHFYR